MKGIHTLIRLHRHELNTLRRNLIRLEDQREKFLVALQGLAEELDVESRLAAEDLTMARYFAAYAENNREKQRLIEDALKQVREQIEQLEEQVRVKYSDLKKYEIARDQAKKKEEAEQARKEQAELDETGLEGFRRKQNNQA